MFQSIRAVALRRPRAASPPARWRPPCRRSPAVEEGLLVHLLRLVGVADEHHVDVLVAALQEDVEQHVEPLGQVLHVLGHRAGDVHQAEHHRLRDRLRLRLEAAIAHVERIDVGDQPGAAQLARRAPPRSSTRSPVVARRRRSLQRVRSRFAQPQCDLVRLSAAAQRDAPRQAVAHRARSARGWPASPARQVANSRRGASSRLGVDHPALGQVGQFEVFEEQVDEFVARQREAEIVLALAVRAAFRAAAARAALRARDGVALDVLLVAGQQMVADAAAARCGGTTARARPAPAATTSPPSSASLMLRLAELSCTALRISALARRMKRCRLARLLPPGLAAVDDVHELACPGEAFVYPACFTRMYHSTSRRTWRSV